MITHALPARNVLRATVTEARIQEQSGNSLVLVTQAVVGAKREISSGDSAMLDQQKLARQGDSVSGLLRIDVLADDAFRVRYAQGEEVPANDTPMVESWLTGPTSLEVDRGEALSVEGEAAPWLKQYEEKGETLGDNEGSVYLRTASHTLAVNLNPLRFELRNNEKNTVLAAWSGPEQNNFANWDAFNTGINRDIESGQPIASECFQIRPDESIYGLGEKFGAFDKVGQTIDLNMVDALGVTSPRSYKNIPFWVSSHGYGVFFNHSSLMSVWAGALSAVDLQVALQDDFLDYTVYAGPIITVLDRYTDMTGKSVLPPAWTFGYWQSKISYTNAEETLDVARKMRENNVPCDVIHLDTHWFKADWYCDLEFDSERFPDPEAYLKELSDMGFKVSLWQIPYIPEGSKLYDDLEAVDGFVKNKDGGLAAGGFCFSPGFKGKVGIIDYTNPEAVRVHQDHFARLFKLGAKVIKTDFGESAPLDGVYHDGTPGHQMHNRYPLDYNKAIFDVTQRETGDGVVWARSAWAGSQRFPIHWGGDNSPNYANMHPQIVGGLSFGMSGFPFWSQDIGGFCGTTNDRLLIRWMQLGMFTSHSRVHGYGDREVYKFSPEALRICRDFIQLRYRLLPYILGQAKRCVETSKPMMRPMVVDYQHDPNTWRISDQFMFGDDLLVAPIFSDGSSRKVYLPAGRWTDWWTHETIEAGEGGRWICVEADLERMPMYLCEGAIVPMGPVMDYVGQHPLNKVTLVTTPLREETTRTLSFPLDENYQQWATATVAGQANGQTQVTVDGVDFDIELVG